MTDDADRRRSVATRLRRRERVQNLRLAVALLPMLMARVCGRSRALDWLYAWVMR